MEFPCLAGDVAGDGAPATPLSWVCSLPSLLHLIYLGAQSRKTIVTWDFRLCTWSFLCVLPSPVSILILSHLDSPILPSQLAPTLHLFISVAVCNLYLSKIFWLLLILSLWLTFHIPAKKTPNLSFDNVMIPLKCFLWEIPGFVTCHKDAFYWTHASLSSLSSQPKFIPWLINCLRVSTHARLSSLPSPTPFSFLYSHVGMTFPLLLTRKWEHKAGEKREENTALNIHSLLCSGGGGNLMHVLQLAPWSFLTMMF